MYLNYLFLSGRSRTLSEKLKKIETQKKGPSIKYVTLFLMIFDPPLPLSQTVTNLGPPLKVCHTSEQKVNKQISRMDTALNNYNRYYYILNNNTKDHIGCF